MRVERDGVTLSETQWGVAVPVDPGLHRVHAAAPGHVPWSRAVEISPEPNHDVVTVPVLQPLPSMRAEAAFFDPLERKVGGVVLGVGAVSLGAGLYFGARAWSKSSDSQRHCEGSQCRTPEGAELREDARRFGTIATWTSIGGLALAGAGVSLFWIAREQAPATSERAVLLLQPARGGAVVGWQGGF
jgi:hypothetical protein